jgi:hypothetical protein
VKFAIAALLGAAAAVKTLESAQYEFSIIANEDDERIIDLVQLEAPCVYLDETNAELDYQVDMFSRTLDKRHWTNAKNIQAQLLKNGQEAKMHVHTWELYDKSFTFPRVRRYEFVQENMDMLEHF